MQQNRIENLFCHSQSIFVLQLDPFIDLFIPMSAHVPFGKVKEVAINTVHRRSNLKGTVSQDFQGLNLLSIDRS